MFCGLREEERTRFRKKKKKKQKKIITAKSELVGIKGYLKIYIPCLHDHFSESVLGSNAWILLSHTQKGAKLCHNGSHFATATRGGPIAVPKTLSALLLAR